MVTTSLQDLRSKKFYVALLAEFLGTLLLVLVACGATAKWIETPSEPSVAQISFAFGLSVATIVWATAHVSGGHINPAVTMAFVVTRRISIIRGLLYIIVQVGGGIVGAGILKGLTPYRSSGIVVLPFLGTSYAGEGMNYGQILGVEIAITFVFVLTVFATVDSKRTDLAGSGPLAIGLAIAMCHLWAVPYTGAGMNPARVFGPAVISGMWHAHWAYWVGPLAGGAVAGWLYEFFFAVNATPAKLKGFFSTVNYDQDKYDQYGRKSSDDDSTEMKAKEEMA